MVEFLLAVLLSINHIDNYQKILSQPLKIQQKITSYLLANNYQSPYVIQRSLPPLPKLDYIAPSVQISAASAVVIDLASGQTLYAKNSQAVMPIASLTKLMTALVFLDTNPDFSQEISIEESDNANVLGSKIYVSVGEKMTVGDLFYASLVGSANNSTKALARSTGLSEEEYLKEMNNKAKSLGLTSTVYKDVTGLNPENASSVQEYSRVAAYAFRNNLIRQALSLPEYSFETIDRKIRHTIRNTNKLLTDSELILAGAKTGYLDEAGYTFVCQASENGHDVMAIIFNSSSSQARFDEAKSLLKWAFNYYQWI